MGRSNYMKNQDIRVFFARAGKAPPSTRLSDAEKFNITARSGAKKFKRKVLGLCGTSTFKTLDELAKVMCEIKMAKSMDEGRILVTLIREEEEITYYYGASSGGFGQFIERRYMHIDEISQDGDKRYRIKVGYTMEK